MLLFLPKTPENNSMIFRKVFIISLLLLFNSCAFEERPHATYTGDIRRRRQIDPSKLQRVISS